MQPAVAFVLDMAKKDSVRSASFDSAGTRLAVVASDGLVRLFAVPPLTNAAVGYPAGGLELAGHRGIITSVAFSKCSDRLATGSYDGTVRIWRYDDLQQAWTARTLSAGFERPRAADQPQLVQPDDVPGVPASGPPVPDGAPRPDDAKPIRVLLAMWTCDDARIVVSVLGGNLQVAAPGSRPGGQPARWLQWLAQRAEGRRGDLGERGTGVGRRYGDAGPRPAQA